MQKEFLAILALVSGISLAADQSPYAGQELRALKSMSAQEIESLRSGGGMGFAKLAELNHYPGPKHVLDLAADLGLTQSQISDTEALFEEMQSMAVVLGEQLIDAEMALDGAFSQGAISANSLQSALLDIGRIRAQLRFVHLGAHLRQKQILTPEQVTIYDETRGYLGEAGDHAGHSEGHN